ncbi:hypothetical protein QT972_14805 [Microcoleus sp. herbarium7]|uniref:hypothetical protein n=1 Tax=Microcoleus sp. herbarium7 TaxID=3055435 RepID=UPI002FD5CBF2
MSNQVNEYAPLDTLKVGDQVAILDENEYHFTVVTEVTPTRIETQRYVSVQFDRTTGHMIGKKYKRYLTLPEEAQAELDYLERMEKLIKLAETRYFTQEEFEKLEKVFNEILKD